MASLNILQSLLQSFFNPYEQFSALNPTRIRAKLAFASPFEAISPLCLSPVNSDLRSDRLGHGRIVTARALTQAKLLDNLLHTD
jgi:hypothetical protein